MKAPSREIAIEATISPWFQCGSNRRKSSSIRAICIGPIVPYRATIYAFSMFAAKGYTDLLILYTLVTDSASQYILLVPTLYTGLAPALIIRQEWHCGRSTGRLYGRENLRILHGSGRVACKCRLSMMSEEVSLRRYPWRCSARDGLATLGGLHASAHVSPHQQLAPVLASTKY